MKKYWTILLIVFILQLPGCVITLQDDAGQIEYYGNETLIRTSQQVTSFFTFPLLYLLTDKIKSNELALMTYILNLLLISFFVLLIAKISDVGYIKLRVLQNNPATNKMHNQVVSNIGIFACRIFHRGTKANKRGNPRCNCLKIK